MSLHPEDPTPRPEETRRVARAAFPRGTLCLDIADALGPIYQDSQFAGLLPRLGQSAEEACGFAEFSRPREWAEADRARANVMKRLTEPLGRRRMATEALVERFGAV